MTVTSGTGGNAIIYMISPAKFVAVSLNDPNPAVLLFEQASPPPTLFLSSLILNPTSVTGGNSSTGTVTLSGPAPTGGAQVTLSSSNTTVARVPSSVTVAAGATSATFTVSTSAVAASTPVIISASYGGVTLTATLTVNPAPVAPSITAQPVSQTVTAGQTATFSVTASGTAPLRYQWQRNGGAIGSATSPSYTTPATSTSDNGAQFTVVVTNSVGIVTSNAATLTVNPAPVAPSITAQPVSLTVTAGQTATFSVTASGTAPLRYQWQRNGGAIGNATSPGYTTPATSTSDNGAQFTVVVTNSVGNVTSNAATLTVTPPPLPTVSSLTLNPTSVVGGLQSSTGTVTLSGPAPAGGATVMLSSSNTTVARVPSSVTVPAGATSATFTVNTSGVLLTTSANISASYNNTTRTATLAVLL